ncbi:MAG TPA: dihydroorotate dehydrogenase [Acidimicrobiales bacterium]|nr:dihydroorotate dehydrogenase [Acidimicrobiales bacterium]
MKAVDLRVHVGSVELPNPVMTAAGTAGHAAELAAYVDLSELGAVVAKSLSAEPWEGNPAPRLHAAAGGGMINSVGLQNPGVEAWLEEDLPALRGAGARVVAGIWGRSFEDYAKAAELLGSAGDEVVAVEVNLSCPNLGGEHEMFSSSGNAAAKATSAALACGKPVWAKLSPAVADLPSVARAVLDAGAEAVTLVNTMPAMVLDLDARRPVLGAGGGGLSGAPLHPIAVRAVWDCHRAIHDATIVGAGGVTTAEDAVELLMAGARAVQVGTASFRDPRATGRILRDLRRWCARHRVARLADLTGAAHA